MITQDDVRQAHADVENAVKLTGAEGAQKIANLIENALAVQNAWLNIVRARMLADAKYIGGTSMRTLAGQLDKSPNAISLWVKEYGPEKYVTVRQDGDEFIIETVERTAVPQLLGAGRRVAPSVLGLYDNDTGLVYEGTAQDLWHQLASQG